MEQRMEAYGVAEVHFQGGRIVHVLLRRTVKIPFEEISVDENPASVPIVSTVR
jgi:hypothetical protein